MVQGNCFCFIADHQATSLLYFPHIFALAIKNWENLCQYYDNIFLDTFLTFKEIQSVALFRWFWEPKCRGRVSRFSVSK